MGALSKLRSPVEARKEVDVDLNLGCHGISDRCFRICGKPMPICARCLVACMGHSLSFTLFVLGRLPALAVSMASTLPIVLDWSLQQYSGIESTNLRRLLTGTAGGFGVGAAICSCLRWICLYLIHSSPAI